MTTPAQIAEIAALTPLERELIEALENAIALIAHKMPWKATALVAGETLVAGDVWYNGMVTLTKAKEPRS